MAMPAPVNGTLGVVAGILPAGPAKPAGAPGLFAEELTRAGQARQLKFSAHAQRRLASREINLDAGRLDRLARAVDQAAARGARDSLMLLDDVGLIVNVPSRTVVTAMDGQRLGHGVITNIDSTIIIRS